MNFKLSHRHKRVHTSPHPYMLGLDGSRIIQRPTVDPTKLKWIKKSRQKIRVKRRLLMLCRLRVGESHRSLLNENLFDTFLTELTLNAYKKLNIPLPLPPPPVRKEPPLLVPKKEDLMDIKPTVIKTEENPLVAETKNAVNDIMKQVNSSEEK
jgi:hypothetical protein